MRILITGGSSGIGEAITRTLAVASADNNIMITYNRSAQNADLLTKEFPNISCTQTDFTNEQSVASLCTLMAQDPFDVLINNAITGISKNYFHKIDAAEFISGFLNNLIPTVRITQAFITSARKRKSGRIITVLSSYIHGAPPSGLSGYVAEKNYLKSLTKSWAIENAPFNIVSNSISPGYISTNLNSDTDERVVEEMTARHPLKKLLTGKEVAETVKFLVYTTAQLNGQDIIINSSQTIG
ncbi:3-oxoacyl-[acyl-carrier-protein] reductase [soil metagenome]